ncbi:hypothetical protein BDN72DRAFT_898506 [Pluteus cervinus]|uniref:Uncharacterized protein n=1 Tax=Pluteus cervinus TaxID=181527 RepID=A0ACD3AQJ7_9AGAR|nr:hypothetical protein BDN72DRAFT_898506 [Pluteus cervinus]
MLARIAARRVPRLATAVPMRFKSSGVEGSVAQSREFGKKEKAHEDQYVHQHEVAQLKKLREQIEKKKTELDALEKEQADLEKKGSQ